MKWRGDQAPSAFQGAGGASFVRAPFDFGSPPLPDPLPRLRRGRGRTGEDSRLPLHAPRELLRHDPLLPAEVRPQRLRYEDAPVRLLVLLEDRDHRSADRDARAVEGVSEPRLPALAAVAHADPPRLEVLAVRDRRDLSIGVLARAPHLEVVGLRGREAHVPRAEEDDAVVEPEAPEDLAGVVHHLLVLGIRLLRLREDGG